MSGKTIFRSATVALALLPLFAATVFAQKNKIPVGDTSTAVDRNNLIVKISTPDETGAGIIVGTRDSDTFIVTAYHVIKDAQKIGVTVFAKKYADVPAEFIKFNEPLDVAVIKISTRADTSLLRLPAIQWREGIRLHERVTVIGHPADLEWVSEAQQVTKLDYQTDPRQFLYSSPTLQRGVSGGPVFDENGALLGMVTARGPSGNAVAVTSAFLTKLLGNEWGIPTSLLVSQSAANPADSRPSNASEAQRPRQPAATLAKSSFLLPTDGESDPQPPADFLGNECCQTIFVRNSDNNVVAKIHFWDSNRELEDSVNIRYQQSFRILISAAQNPSEPRSKFESREVQFWATDPPLTENAADVGGLHFVLRLMAAESIEESKGHSHLVRLNSVQVRVWVSVINAGP